MSYLPKMTDSEIHQILLQVSPWVPVHALYRDHLSFLGDSSIICNCWKRHFCHNKKRHQFLTLEKHCNVYKFYNFDLSSLWKEPYGSKERRIAFKKVNCWKLEVTKSLQLSLTVKRTGSVTMYPSLHRKIVCINSYNKNSRTRLGQEDVKSGGCNHFLYFQC